MAEITETTAVRETLNALDLVYSDLEGVEEDIGRSNWEHSLVRVDRVIRRLEALRPSLQTQINRRAQVVSLTDRVGTHPRWSPRSPAS